MANNILNFIGGPEGQWKIIDINPVIGQSLDFASYLNIEPNPTIPNSEVSWTLRGVVSNHRYTEKQENDSLAAIQAGLGRTEATLAALIPIKKSDFWWQLAQDERRNIFEQQSRHINTGIKFLPAIARKLYHCRDIGEPFDFLTWFEYAPSHSDEFEQLVTALRKTKEWEYVDREVDIRLAKL